jgi:hypothetical protein
LTLASQVPQLHYRLPAFNAGLEHVIIDLKHAIAVIDLTTIIPLFISSVHPRPDCDFW